MLKIAVCEDDTAQMNQISAAVQRYCSARGKQEVQIDSFSAPLSFLSRLDKTGGYDIVLQDICMPGILGTAVAKEIRRRRDKTEIVFFNASKEYAVDVFARRAAHYLLKPFTQEQLDEAIDRAIRLFSNRCPPSVAAGIGCALGAFAPRGKLPVREK